MRLQYADFIRKGEGLTESPAVQNLLDADVMYMTVISETDPDVTVEVMTGKDPATGIWIDGTILQPDGTKVESVTANGIYSVPLGGVRYVRVKNGSADATLEVYASFNDALKIENEVSGEVKTALLDCFDNVAWATPDGKTYYDFLAAALNPPSDLAYITAAYTQTMTVDITDPLSVLREDLVVTAYYSDGTISEVTAYLLSGTLKEGTSTITASYGGKSATFDVTVTDSALIYELASPITFTGQTSEIVDTGVKAIPTDRNTTFLIDFTPDDPASNNGNYLFYAGLLSGTYNAVCIRCYNTAGTYSKPRVETHSSGSGFSIDNVTYGQPARVVIRYTAGATSLECFCKASGTTITGTSSNTGVVADATMKLGGINSSFNRYKGDVDVFKIYSRKLTDAEVNEFLEGV